MTAVHTTATRGDRGVTHYLKPMANSPLIGPGQWSLARRAPEVTPAKQAKAPAAVMAVAAMPIPMQQLAAGQVTYNRGKGRHCGGRWEHGRIKQYDQAPSNDWNDLIAGSLIIVGKTGERAGADVNTSDDGFPSRRRWWRPSPLGWI